MQIQRWDTTETKYVTEEFFAKMKSGLVQSGDVLLYKDGGKPWIFLPRVSFFGDGFPFSRCAINEHVFRIRVSQYIGQSFLYFWLWHDVAMHDLKHRGGKAAIPGINQTDVKELKLLVASREILFEFAKFAAPFFSKINENAKQSLTIATLRDTLLPRLMSGQLRVPEAEQQIAEVM